MTEDPFADWYESATGDLEQGDLLTGFDLLVPRPTNDGYTFGRRAADVLLLTQTCDLLKPAQQYVLLADVHTYETLANGGGTYASTEFRKNAARGLAVAEFLLPPHTASDRDWAIVSFRDIFSVPKQTVLAHAEKQAGLRLCSPYKEHLSQAFARFVMRVGLPSTLSSFERWSKPT